MYTACEFSPFSTSIFDVKSPEENFWQTVAVPAVQIDVMAHPSEYMAKSVALATPASDHFHVADDVRVALVFVSLCLK
jgi:hypothetical protein